MNELNNIITESTQKSWGWELSQWQYDDSAVDGEPYTKETANDSAFFYHFTSTTRRTPVDTKSQLDIPYNTRFLPFNYIKYTITHVHDDDEEDGFVGQRWLVCSSRGEGGSDAGEVVVMDDYNDNMMVIMLVFKSFFVFSYSFNSIAFM